MTLRLNNVRLLVSDFPICFAFYRDVLGLTPTFGAEDANYAEFDVGVVKLALYHRELMSAVLETSTKPAHAEMQDHVALIFQVDSVDETAKTLVGRGVELATEPTDRAAWGIRAAHFRDPDGNLIEIYQDLRG